MKPLPLGSWHKPVVIFWHHVDPHPGSPGREMDQLKTEACMIRSGICFLCEIAPRREKQYGWPD
jgi:hypothetical protein